ncbi:DNA internalization-related competence protein ComEC/Rec2 [Alkalimarinus alittae]|uniref:DNA internalization-related competence protein ComEC/Rec2 n=1 Tax=Alkalimarinus alittae TaxID=2961619 RepID=A0ABY6N788_9ALTE|nr:DNA internalization-related competence protein ComEC/Rec2 [Alkalimarinus alittae]UZE97949.1 DNA internalization-related competence protein ComEC/Rec2 [Alkalimarinus alittae]
MRSWMIAYVAGVVVFHVWGTLLPVAYSAILFVISIVVFTFQSRVRWLSFFLVSVAWSSTYSELNKNSTLDYQYESKNLITSGYVCSIPKLKDTVVSFELCDSTIRYTPNSPVLAEGLHLTLSWYVDRSTFANSKKTPSNAHAVKQRDTKHIIGKQTFVVRLKRPHGMVNPYGFVYEKWLFRKGVNAVGYVKQSISNTKIHAEQIPVEAINELSTCEGAGVACLVTGFRIRINERLSALSGTLPHIPLIKALSVGFRGDIAPDAWTLFKHTGTQHLIAISGLHIGLVFGIAMGIAALFWRMINRVFARTKVESFNTQKQFSSIFFALGCALTYSAMAGFLVSTQRALIMLAVYYVCGLARKHIKPNTRLLIAATVVLLLDPNAVLDYGFWLSFMAVWVLFFITASHVKDKSGRMAKWFKASTSMQWVIFIGLCPILLASGMGVSYTSLIANFVAIPLVGVVTVPLVLVGLVVMPFSSWVFDQIMIIANTSLEWLFRFLAVFREFEVVSINDETRVITAAISLLSLVIILLPGWRSVKLWLVITVGMLLWFKPNNDNSSKPELVIFDVGQGLAVAAVKGNQAFVYDTGPAYRVGSAAQRSLVPYLNAKGISHIEMLIVSHGDDDHSGGLADLEQAFSLGRLITGQPERLSTQHPVERCENGLTKTAHWYKAQFYYLPAISARPLSANNHSCVVKLTLGGRSVLLMGDIEKQAERLLVSQYGDDLKADVLVAGHHGSKNATSQYLIDHVMPDQVIFSAGYKSRFNHPHPDAVERAVSNGAKVFNTAESGAIILKQAENNDWVTVPYRERINAFWMF